MKCQNCSCFRNRSSRRTCYSDCTYDNRLSCWSDDSATILKKSFGTATIITAKYDETVAVEKMKMSAEIEVGSGDAVDARPVDGAEA